MDTISYLKDNNVKPSLQRIRIFEYLYTNKTHPTVDTIYNDLIGDLPTLSKTTVYNTLKLFIDNGITSTLSIDGNELRYDVIMDDHGHFKCDQCGSIYDVEVDLSTLKFKKMRGFKINKTHIHLNGRCKECITK